MCGFAGIISKTQREKIHAMTTALSHRGPDGEGFYKDNKVALGHRRLSIIDISGGKQPISNESDEIYLVCNGEIYNSPELRVELIEKGHVFKTATDVEVILHLYEEYGVDCVKYLRGMFAFAIWEPSFDRLMLAKDHMGQKPLFFARAGEDLLFGSEVKSILAADLVQVKPNMNAFWHYMSLRFIPDQLTLFEGIEKLPAASTLLWEKGNIDIKRYWSLNFTEKLTGSEEQIADELDDVISESVKMHLLSDVQVGSFLSGGIDSSLITAMMADITGQEFPTFSIGVKEQSFNELPYATMVSDKYGLDAKQEIVKADLIRMMPSMIYHLDEPSDPFGVGVFLVSQVASEHVKVVLSGDGGDENFAGYDRFAGQKLADYYAVLPEWFRRHVMSRMIKLVPESFAYKSLQQKALWMNDMSFYGAGERYAQSMSFLRFTSEHKSSLFSESIKKSIDADSVEMILRYYDAENVDDFVDRMLYTDLMTRMPDHLLSIVDRMSMAHSLESRPPLMDHRVIEYAAKIPASMKLKGKDLKYMLKKVASRYLPDELIYRKKQGFSFPIATWLRTDLKKFTENLFEQSRFVELGYFEKAYIAQLLDEHMQGKMDHNFRIWILINMEFWYRLYFENMSIGELEQLVDDMM